MRLIFVVPLLIALFMGQPGGSGGGHVADPGGQGGGGYRVTGSGIPGGSGGGGMAADPDAWRW